jgi:hypothetical protein
VSALNLAYRFIDFPVASLRDVTLWAVGHGNFIFEHVAAEKLDVADWREFARIIWRSTCFSFFSGR